MHNFASLKIALIADEITSTSLEDVCKIKHITPLNYKVILKFWRPDLLLVESSWRGYKSSWKQKIASYPNKNNRVLEKLVNYYRDYKIPTVFWNKEDGVHFNRFIDSAKLFEHIFTTDLNMIPKYREICNNTKSIDCLQFAVNTKIHYPKDVERQNRSCFVGSYNRKEHPKRLEFLDIAFGELSKSGLDIYDRNYGKNNDNFAFPAEYKSSIYPAINHKKTADIYSKYLISLNANIVTDSPTMFSRRIIEAMACKSLVVSNASKAIENCFDNCIISIKKKSDFEQIKDIISNPNYISKKVNEAYDVVLKNFTIDKWLEKIVSKTK